jgi:hypothetical protein
MKSIITNFLRRVQISISQCKYFDDDWQAGIFEYLGSLKFKNGLEAPDIIICLIGEPAMKSVAVGFLGYFFGKKKWSD